MYIHEHTYPPIHRLKYLNLADNELHIIPHLRLLGTFPFKPTSPHTQTQRHAHSEDTQTLHAGPTTTSTHTQLQPDTQRKEAKTTNNRRTQTPTDHKCLESDSDTIEPDTSTQIHPEVSLHRPLTHTLPEGALNKVGDSPSMVGAAAQQVVRGEVWPEPASRQPPSMAPFPQLQTLDVTNNLVRIMCFTMSKYILYMLHYITSLIHCRHLSQLV